MYKIEEAMRVKLKDWKGFSKKEVSLDEAKKVFGDNKYKIELAEEFAAGGKTLTIYTIGGFDDLCKGGHADDLSSIDPQLTACLWPSEPASYLGIPQDGPFKPDHYRY